MNINFQTLILLSRASVKLSTAFIIHTQKGINTGIHSYNRCLGYNEPVLSPDTWTCHPPWTVHLLSYERNLSHPTIVPFQCVIYFTTSLCRLRPSPVECVERAWEQSWENISDNQFTIHNSITCTFTADITDISLGVRYEYILTHLGRDKMAAISQTTLSDAF